MEGYVIAKVIVPDDAQWARIAVPVTEVFDRQELKRRVLDIMNLSFFRPIDVHTEHYIPQAIRILMGEE